MSEKVLRRPVQKTDDPHEYTPNSFEIDRARVALVALYPGLPLLVGHRVKDAAILAIFPNRIIYKGGKSFLIYDPVLEDFHFVDLDLHTCTCKDYYLFGHRAPCAHRLAAWLWYFCWSGGLSPQP